MSQHAGDRLRAICLGLPETAEKAMRRGPSYRVNDKIFATERMNTGRLSVCCKVPAGSQAVLLGADGKRFFVPPYFGAKGWIGMWLDDGVDWNEVTFLVKRSYRLVAP